jgi:hypothetical protein
MLMIFNGFLWNLMDFNGFLWMLMDFCGFLMDFNGFLMDVNGFLWNLMDFTGASSNSGSTFVGFEVEEFFWRVMCWLVLLGLDGI